MNILLQNDILGGQYKAGDMVKVTRADNLSQGGFWLAEGKDANGIPWKEHPCGFHIDNEDVHPECLDIVNSEFYKKHVG